MDGAFFFPDPLVSRYSHPPFPEPDAGARIAREARENEGGFARNARSCVSRGTACVALFTGEQTWHRARCRGTEAWLLHRSLYTAPE